MDERPKAFSTPKHVYYLRGRPGIREHDSVQSPIENDDSSDEFHQSPIGQNLSNEENSACEDNISDSELFGESKILPSSDSLRNSKSDCKEQNTSNSNNEQICNFWIYISIPIFSVFAAILCAYIARGEYLTDISKIDHLVKEFPSQTNDFWLSIEVAINEINRSHKPVSVILLYQSGRSDTLNKILEGITSYAVCEITTCSSKPIIINGSDLNSAEIVRDYGKIIARYKEELQDTGVMIIKNLEKIPGVSAQAFHSLCDQINPVVGNALFLFTMEVDSFHDNNVKLIENQLRNLWSDLNDEKFHPLFTRISEIVLPITVES